MRSDFHLTAPPMGWNSWNTFYDQVSEDLIRSTADAIVDKGLAKAGYEYVIMDDCWSQRTRDDKGRLVPNPVKFPNGIKAVADYVHARGLKLGIYSCCGVHPAPVIRAALNMNLRTRSSSRSGASTTSSMTTATIRRRFLPKCCIAG